MSDLQSLLKYRYQPKPASQTSVGENTPSSSSSQSSEVISIQDSPVFNRKSVVSKRSVHVILSDSDEGSPIKRKTTAPSFTQDNGSKLSSLDRISPEVLTNLNTLQSMFPKNDRQYILQVLQKNNNIAGPTITDLIHYNNRKSAPRLNSEVDIAPSSQTFQSSNESQQPAYKRIRQMSGDSEEERKVGVLTEQQKLDILTRNFPNSTSQIRKNALCKANYDVDTATNILCNWMKEPISLTSNKGSIKAFHEAQMKATLQNTILIEDDDDDSDAVEVIEDPSTIVNTKKNGGKLRTGRSGGGKLLQLTNHDFDDDVEDGDFSESDSDNDHPLEDQNPILKFLNSGTYEELVSIPGCSKKKADVLLSMRPFSDWGDLAQRLEAQKMINLISGTKEVLHIRKVVTRLMEHCSNISSTMGSLVNDIQEKPSLDQAVVGQDAYLARQPSILNSSLELKPFQIVGLNWLVLMHRQNLNGILADEMGLGKTIQTIAFLSQLLAEGNTGPHVIIAPSSTIDNWLRELQLWCPSMKVMLYYGSQEDRAYLRSQIADGKITEYNVILTSYNMATGGIEDRVLFKKNKFCYAVFDEGHMLKNMGSLRYQNLMKIKAKRRLLLTGTPLQNNLVELMSLLCFVMPEMFSGKTQQLKKMFESITNQKNDASRGVYEKETITKAKFILKPFFLRRLKVDVMKQLAKKTEHVNHVVLDPDQQKLYEKLKTQYSQNLKGENLELTGEKQAVSVLMELRKAANHRLLHRTHYTDSKLKEMAALMLNEPTHCDANKDLIFEDMQVMTDFELHRLCTNFKSIKRFQIDMEVILKSGKMQHLDKLLPEMKCKGDRVLLFSQFTMVLDIMEVYMKERGHSYLRLDGRTPVVERQELIDKYTEDASIFIFLLSTKAGGLGINLIAANTVIIHDIDFNPYNDKQAEDRCHRVGQTKNVSVYRLISKNTVEEAMYQCAQNKLKLEADVTGGKASNKENPNDVKNLLQQALVT